MARESDNLKAGNGNRDIPEMFSSNGKKRNSKEELLLNHYRKYKFIIAFWKFMFWSREKTFELLGKVYISRK